MEIPGREVLIIAGPNGSGKTTVAREFLLEHDMTFLNADEIAAGIEDGAGKSVRIQAGRIFLERLSECIRLNRSFAVETTLAGSYIVKMIEQLRTEGYAVSLSFIFVESPEVAIDRIRARVRRGGTQFRWEDSIGTDAKLQRRECSGIMLPRPRRGCHQAILQGNAQLLAHIPQAG